MLYAQPYDGVTYGSRSQVIPDNAGFTSYCFDDFAVTGTGWDISKVTAFGYEMGNPGLNTAVGLAFTTRA